MFKLDPIPKDMVEALGRELVGFVPIVGDAFCLIEAVKAFEADKGAAGALYLLSALPGPPLPPLAHLIAYSLEKK